MANKSKLNKNEVSQLVELLTKPEQEPKHHGEPADLVSWVGSLIGK